MTIRILNEDCLAALPRLAAEGFRAHSVICDPPYHLTSKPGGSGGFMGKTWDGGDIALRPETWRMVFDCMLPGAYLLAFGGTRTWHRQAIAIEDAGFEIRDTIMWLYGSGFPKSLDVSKAIDKAAGAEREVVGKSNRHVSGRPEQRTEGLSGSSTFAETVGMGAFITAPATDEAAAWQGWGTALKPSAEPIVLARKPFRGTVAANVLAHGTGAMNIDACRIAHNEPIKVLKAQTGGDKVYGQGGRHEDTTDLKASGRWPANVIHDGSDEVEAAFAAFGEKTSGQLHPWHDAKASDNGSMSGGNQAGRVKSSFGGDSGSASRFFYTAKADAKDRAGSKHPTVKPTDLMRYLVQLVTPKGGTVLDPFAGSGSTGLAADQVGCDAVLVERDPQYATDIERKIVSDCPLFAEVVSS